MSLSRRFDPEVPVRDFVGGHEQLPETGNPITEGECVQSDAAPDPLDIVLVKADIGTAAVAATLTRHAIDAFGRLDVLVNNAAWVIDKPTLEMAEADRDVVLDVNLKGAFLCPQHAARQMLAQDDGGAILNIGIRGRRNGVSTCAPKAGLMIMTQCFALELAPRSG